MRILLKKLKCFARYTLVFITSITTLGATAHAQVFTYGETVSVSAIVGTVSDPVGGTFSVPEYPIVGFSGYAYPFASVVLLKNTTERTRVTADATGFFSLSIPEVFESTTLYTLYAEDRNLERSLLLNYPLAVTRGVVTQVSGIVFAPTISTDKVSVKRGDSVEVFGAARPERKLILTLSGERGEKTYQVTSAANGSYSLALSTQDIQTGEYVLSVHYEGDRRPSKLVRITVGVVTQLRSNDITTLPGDCNKDTNIDLRDFSVAAFWYLRPNPPSCIDTNDDNIIDIVDFSILAFYWTG